MELHVLKEDGRKSVVLMDDEMRIVRPVYDFLKFQKQRDRAFNTLKANGNDLRLYWEFLTANGFKYDEVSPNTIACFIDYLRQWEDDLPALYKESKRTNRTINRILSTVHMFYQFQADMLEIDNPMLTYDINRPSGMFKSILYHARSDNRTKQSIFKVRESDYAVRLVTEDEMEVFISYLTKKRDILLYKLLYFTGARIQEILDLEIDAVPVPDMTKAVGILPWIKSKGKKRNLFVPMPLIAELDTFIFEERLKIETEHNVIFVSEKTDYLGKPLTYRAAYDKLKQIGQKTGIIFRFHDLRHTFCSNLIQSGMDASIVRIIMGHEHISTRQKYTHLSDPYIEDSLSRYWDKSILIGGGNDGK